jgi:hypothetical protein
MKYFNQFVSRVCESQKGQTMTEYVLIIAAIRGSRLPRVPGSRRRNQLDYRQRYLDPVGCVRKSPQSGAI